ncbi:MAG: phospholipase D-like domain-containing protein, partial [Chloroflexota bacterium]
MRFRRTLTIAALWFLLEAGAWHPAAAATLTGSAGPGIVPARVMIEPRDGIRALIRFIDKSQHLLFVECYILTDKLVVRGLERAAAQGVRVFVMLEPHPLGMGTQPQRMADQLRAAGIAFRWSSPSFALTHAKFIVADDRRALISTANMSRSAFSGNREFLVVDDVPADVRTVSAIFRDDWDRLSATPRDPNIVVSPRARAPLDALLRRAHRELDLYSEELLDGPTAALLESIARRGVRVRVLLPSSATPIDGAALARSGVRIRLVAKPYIHAKAVLI